MEIPTITNYMDYSSNNYGSSRAVHIGSLSLYFSYDTVIAFNSKYTGMVIRKNDWSTTTGKHLNAIDPDHNIRIDGSEFETRLQEMLVNYQLTEKEITV